MSFFSWLFSKSSPQAQIPLVLNDKQVSAQPTAGLEVPVAVLKRQRHLNRESLYEVVRSVMLRSEVLSSHFKFKVLSLDTRGRQFLVMIELLNDTALQPHHWRGIEQLMTLTALQHHDIEIKGLYWRLPMPSRGASAAMPAQPELAKPLAATVVTANAVATPHRHGFEPIHQDEMLAFKKAIADGTPTDKSAIGFGKVFSSGPRRPAPEHGYEDTQLLEPDDGASPLSKTQFGGLD